MSCMSSRLNELIFANLSVVNYSISLGLGFAGTVLVHFNDGDALKGYQAALYMGIGLAGLGLLLSVTFLITRVYMHTASPSGASP